MNDRLKADLERFDHVIYQSAFSKEQADVHLYRRTNNYSIIHNGVDTQFFRPREVATRDARPTIMVLAKHHPKDLALALDGFKRVGVVLDARLLIVGPMRDGASSAATFVTEYLKMDNCGKDIKCLNTIPYEKIPDTLAQADVFLHVKIVDSCPNAVIEALACGLPVVCPAWGGTKELIGAGGIAVAGPPWGVDDALRDGMAEAVLQILAKIDDYKTSAFSISQNKYDRYVVVQEYLEAMQIMDEVE